MYLKRYVRFAVPVAAGIIFTLGFLGNLSNGPTWDFLTGRIGIDMCKNNWWSTLLFVGNLATPGKLCFGHSWYLMVDMQLYFSSPLILYPLWRFQKHFSIMIPVIFLIASISVIYVFVIFLVKDLRISNLAATGGFKDALVHTMTIARIDSWMMGIFVGYVMYLIEGKSVRLSKRLVATLWMLTVVSMLTVIFVQYPLLQENYQEINPIADAFYESFKRLFWCLAVGWIIIACHQSYGDLVKRFLSLSVWLPISKLSFAIYLIHIPVIFVHISSVRAPQYFSHFTVIMTFFGYFGVTFFIAFAWALMFELPITVISACLLAKTKKSVSV